MSPPKTAVASCLKKVESKPSGTSKTPKSLDTSGSETFNQPTPTILDFGTPIHSFVDKTPKNHTSNENFGRQKRPFPLFSLFSFPLYIALMECVA